MGLCGVAGDDGFAFLSLKVLLCSVCAPSLLPPPPACAVMACVCASGVIGLVGRACITIIYRAWSLVCV